MFAFGVLVSCLFYSCAAFTPLRGLVSIKAFSNALVDVAERELFDKNMDVLIPTTLISSFHLGYDFIFTSAFLSALAINSSRRDDLDDKWKTVSEYSTSIKFLRQAFLIFMIIFVKNVEIAL